MSWILFSILSAVVWAIVNTVDKYVLTKLVKKPVVPLMILGIIGLIASFFVHLFHGFSYLSYFNIALAFVAGILYVIGILFYFKAVKIEEISRVIPLLYLSSLFVSILAAIFLGEIFTPIKYLGIFLLIIGAVSISSKNFIKFGFGKAFWFMVLASLVFSINAVITKYLLNFVDFWTIFSYIRIGAFFALIPTFCFSFKDLILAVREHGKKTVILISLNEILALFAVILITIAMTKGYITLVNALSSVQPFFVLLIAVILSVFYPKILKEEIGKSAILLKLIAITLMFVGVILII